MTKLPNPFEVLNRPNPFKPATMPNPFETVLAEIAEIMEAKPEVIKMRRPRLRDILTQFDERGRRIEG
jgi:hypothetical protein